MPAKCAKVLASDARKNVPKCSQSATYKSTYIWSMHTNLHTNPPTTMHVRVELNHLLMQHQHTPLALYPLAKTLGFRPDGMIFRHNAPLRHRPAYSNALNSAWSGIRRAWSGMIPASQYWNSLSHSSTYSTYSCTGTAVHSSATAVYVYVQLAVQYY